MKKLLVFLVLILGLGFCANANIRAGNTGGKVSNGYQYYQMSVQAQPAPTSSALVWYADNILGYSVIGIEGFDVSAGSAPTTISAQALYPNGSAVSVAAQIITAGTDLTDLKSSHYRFTLPAASVTRNITFNFLIAD